MLILALDTASRGGSIALAKDDIILGVLEGESSLTHGQRLPLDIMRLLSMHDREVDAVDVFAVAAGPGSFTGLRVGIATIQGLAFGLGRRVAPVSSFDALLAATVFNGLPPHIDVIATLIDAHRGEVFAATFERASRESSSSDVVEVLASAGRTIPPGWVVWHTPSVATPAAIVNEWRSDFKGRRVWFAGDGARKSLALIQGEFGNDCAVASTVPLLAPSIARLVSTQPIEQLLPHAVRPIYVRRSDAELARERRTDPARAEPAAVSSDPVNGI